MSKIEFFLALLLIFAMFAGLTYPQLLKASLTLSTSTGITLYMLRIIKDNMKDKT
jgi:hypothetical protein